MLYISGEESIKQTKLRADRLGIESASLHVLAETDMEYITSAIQEMKPAFVVVDSIQTVYQSDITSAPGSVSQVRECTAQLMKIAKTNGIPIFIVGHVTKEGSIAGPRLLEHMVDTVLYFEGERHHTFRILRAVKNRFGSTNELGIFEMRGRAHRGIKPIRNLLRRAVSRCIWIVCCCLNGRNKTCSSGDTSTYFTDELWESTENGYWP